MSDNTPTNDTPTDATPADEAEVVDTAETDAEQLDVESAEPGAPRRRFFTGRKALALAAVIGLGLGVGGYAVGDALIGGHHDRDRHGQYEDMGDHAPMGDRGGMPHGDRDGHGPMGDGAGRP